MSRILTIYALSLLLVLSVTPLFAYLDPGSGSMLIQVMLGAMAALFVVMRAYWDRIIGIFRSPGKKSTDSSVARNESPSQK